MFRRLLTWAALFGLMLAMAGSVAGQPAKKPRVPPGRDPGGVAVAVVGGGVNYLLPHITGRLARDGEGELVGWDFVDNDQRPLEPYGGLSTALASIVLREAGATRLAVVRDKPGDAHSHAKAVVLLSRSPARIVLMLSSSTDRKEWEPFAQAAAHFQDLLFIVPAGDEDRDLDQAPAHPASLGLANVLVVAAVNGSGQPLPRASKGARTVDVAVPAENLEALGTDGAKMALSGSAAAAARTAAMAARVLAVEPGLAGAAFKQKILSHAKPLPADSAMRARAGWIAGVDRINGPDR